MDYYEKEDEQELNRLLAKIVIACLIGVLIVFSTDSYMDRHAPNPCDNTGTSRQIKKPTPMVLVDANNRA